MKRPISLALSFFLLCFGISASAAGLPAVDSIKEITKENIFLKIDGILKEDDETISYDSHISVHEEPPVIRSTVDAPFICVVTGTKEGNELTKMSLLAYPNPERDDDIDPKSFLQICDEYLAMCFGEDPDIISQLKEVLRLDEHINEDGLKLHTGWSDDNDVYKFSSNGRQYGINCTTFGGVMQILSIETALYDIPTAFEAASPSATPSLITIEKATVKNGRLYLNIKNITEAQTFDAIEVLIIAMDSDGHYMRSDNMGPIVNAFTFDATFKPAKLYKMEKNPIKLENIPESEHYYVTVSRVHELDGETIIISPEEYIWTEI